MQEKILAILKSLGLIPADKEEAVKTALAEIKLEPTAPVIDASKLTDPQLKTLIETLNSTVAANAQDLKTMTALFAQEKAQREASIKAQQDADAATKKANAEKLIGEALKNGKIAEADKQKYIDKAIADYDGTKGDIERFATIPGFKPAPGASEKNEPPKNVSTLRGPLSSADPTILAAINKMEAAQQ